PAACPRASAACPRIAAAAPRCPAGGEAVLCRWWRWWRQALRVLGASLYVNGLTPLLRPIERTSWCLANAGGSAAVGTLARLECFSLGPEFPSDHALVPRTAT